MDGLMNRPELRVVFEPEIPGYDPELYRYQKVAEGVTGFGAVNEEELDRFRQRGYLVVQEAFTMAQVEAARQELYRLGTSPQPDCESVYFEGAVRQQLPALQGKPVSASSGRRFVDLALGHTGKRLPSLEPAARMRFVRKFMGFTREENPGLKDLAEAPALIRVVSRLLGAKPTLYQDMALIKPPGGREKPWHQDRAYFNLTQTTPIVGIWIALDEATPENGCMQVVEGGHRQGPRLHFLRRDWQICDSEVARLPRVAIPMRSGGCLLFDALLPHGNPRQPDRPAALGRAVSLRVAGKPGNRGRGPPGRVRFRGQGCELLSCWGYRGMIKRVIHEGTRREKELSTKGHEGPGRATKVLEKAQEGSAKGREGEPFAKFASVLTSN